MCPYEQTDVMTMIGGLRFRLATGRWTPEDPEAQRRRDGTDIAVFAYAHVAAEAGIDPPYPPNAAVLAGKSIYG